MSFYVQDLSTINASVNAGTTASNTAASNATAANNAAIAANVAATAAKNRFFGLTCKAWVVFGVAGAVCTVNSSFNVSGVSRASAGIFTVGFTTSLSTVRPALDSTVASNGTNLSCSGSTTQTSQYSLTTLTPSLINQDPDGAVYCAWYE